MIDTVALESQTPRRRWIGRVVTALPALFLVFDATIKVAHLGPVSEAFARMQIPDRLAPAIGILELVLLLLHLVPRTARIGLVLLTGFLGGAVALHLRLGDPLVSHTLFPIYVGALLWLGLLLRDEATARALWSAPSPRR